MVHSFERPTAFAHRVSRLLDHPGERAYRRRHRPTQGHERTALSPASRGVGIDISNRAVEQAAATITTAANAPKSPSDSGPKTREIGMSSANCPPCATARPTLVSATFRRKGDPPERDVSLVTVASANGPTRSTRAFVRPELDGHGHPRRSAVRARRSRRGRPAPSRTWSRSRRRSPQHHPPAW